jgi:hypothetical protein
MSFQQTPSLNSPVEIGWVYHTNKSWKLMCIQLLNIICDIQSDQKGNKSE